MARGRRILTSIVAAGTALAIVNGDQLGIGWESSVLRVARFAEISGTPQVSLNAREIKRTVIMAR